MAVLHNRISQKELKELLYQETTPRTTISFYQYFYIEDPQLFRDELYTNLFTLKVFGRIYVAAEGIHAKISVPVENMASFKNYLYSMDAFKRVRIRIAVVDDGNSFWVLKMKVGDQLVAVGIEDSDFDMLM